jgi:phosphohistidine swiveling domain-containing protein
VARTAADVIPAAGGRDGWLVLACGAPEEASDRVREEDEARVGRFRRYSIDHAELLGEILEVAPVTAARGRRILERLDRVVADYQALFASVDAEAAEVPGRYSPLREKLAAAIDGAADDQVLPPGAAYLVQAFEDPASVGEVRTLHGLKRFLHQRGLRHAFRLFGSAGQANRSVDLLLIQDEAPPVLVRQIRYIDFEGQTSGLPLPVRLVAQAYRAYLLHGVSALPRIRILVYGTEVQTYIWFRNHPAFVRLDLSPPHRGGMIDLECYAVSQYELAQHPDPEVPGLQRVLRRIGFFVEMDGTRLHARYDKERATQLSEIIERAGLLFRLAPRLMDLDWALSALDARPARREAIAEYWSDLLIRQGLIPLDAAAAPAAPGRDGGRRLRELRSVLRRCGLRVEPSQTRYSGHPAGQLDLEREILVPLREACRRGEVVERDGVLVRGLPDHFRREHEAVRLARIVIGGGAPLGRAAQTASLVAPLERWLRFRATGSVAGYSVERATLALRDGEATVCVARDAHGAIVLAFATRGQIPFLARSRRRQPWRRPAEFSPADLRRCLVRDNYLAPATVDADAVNPHAVAATFFMPNPRAIPAPLEGDRRIPGLAASPGRASGFVRLATAGRNPGDYDGAVLVAPTIQPGDAPLLARAAAIVSTGGGTLSHAGLLALELGRPSLVVPGRWRRTPGGEDVLVLRRTDVRERRGRLGRLEVCCWFAIRQYEEQVREGDLVVVDAVDGTLGLLGADRDALALHQGLRELDAAGRAIATAADDAALLTARGQLLRVGHQLLRLVARLDRPVLAHYAVRELVAAQAESCGSAAAPHRRRLVQALCQSPVAGPAARAALRAATDYLEHRFRGLSDLIRTGLDAFPGVLEVIFVRLSAARVARALQGVGELRELHPGGPAAPASTARGDGGIHSVMAEVDSLAMDRLLQFREILVHELRGARLAREPAWRLDTVLQAVAWIDQVLRKAEPPPERPLMAWARQRVRAPAVSARDRLGDRLILPAHRAGRELAPLIGRKAATLGDIIRVLGPEFVPGWFAITDRAFRIALAAPHASADLAAPTLEAAIEKVLARSDLEPAGKARAIRDLWSRAPLPEPLTTAVVEAYRNLAEEGASPFVALRSSAFEEDAAGRTWAGQFDSYLFLRGEEDVLRHLRLVWAGLWNPRALHHRALGEGGGPQVGGGVLVQRMVDARVSGVLLTVNPAQEEMREMVVNVGLGLGEGVVSGRVDADEIHVAREPHHGGALRLRYQVAEKRYRILPDRGRGRGTRRAETLFHQRLRPALEYIELEGLVRAARALEAAFRHPLDLEFALEGPDLRVLQVRPVPLFHSALTETVERFPFDSNPSERSR